MSRPLPKMQPVVRVVASTMLGDRIARRRKRLRLSPNSLAIHTELTDNLIKRIEAGVVAKPDLFEIAALASALGCTVDELLRGIPTNDAELIDHLRRQRPDVVDGLRLGMPPPAEEDDDAVISATWTTCAALAHTIRRRSFARRSRYNPADEA